MTFIEVGFMPGIWPQRGNLDRRSIAERLRSNVVIPFSPPRTRVALVVDSKLIIVFPT